MDDQPRACPGTECWCDTENLNTVQFHQCYRMTGLNQHKYQFRGSDDQWSIEY